MRWVVERKLKRMLEEGYTFVKEGTDNMVSNGPRSTRYLMEKIPKKVKNVRADRKVHKKSKRS